MTGQGRKRVGVVGALAVFALASGAAAAGDADACRLSCGGHQVGMHGGPLAGLTLAMADAVDIDPLVGEPNGLAAGDEQQEDSGSSQVSASSDSGGESAGSSDAAGHDESDGSSGEGGSVVASADSDGSDGADGDTGAGNEDEQGNSEAGEAEGGEAVAEVPTP